MGQCVDCILGSPRPQESPDTMSTGSIVDMHLRYQEPEKKSQRKS